MTIEIRDLSYAPPGSAGGIHLPELTVEQGERLAVIGPSGCGKTTLLNLISALLTPTTGTIDIDGMPVHTLSRRAAREFRSARIGYIFQDFGLLDYLTARDNILHPFRIARGRTVTPTVRARVDEIARDLAIDTRLDHRPNALSQGEKQRVAICRAVVTDPSILLADEPTGNLDPETATRIMDHLMAEKDRLGATLVMVTHDHALLDRFDRTLDLRGHWGAL